MLEVAGCNGTCLDLHAQQRSIGSFNQKINFTLAVVAIMRDLILSAGIGIRRQLMIDPCLDELTVTGLVQINVLLI